MLGLMSHAGEVEHRFIIVQFAVKPVEQRRGRRPVDASIMKAEPNFSHMGLRAPDSLLLEWKEGQSYKPCTSCWRKSSGNDRWRAALTCAPRCLNIRCFSIIFKFAGKLEAATHERLDVRAGKPCGTTGYHSSFLHTQAPTGRGNSFPDHGEGIRNSTSRPACQILCGSGQSP